MGFLVAWTMGVSTLYSFASSSDTIKGHVGRRFELSRFVRQGCPLALYLFLFVAEMMSDFIRVHQPTLRGLLMPVIDEPNLIDQKYADDTLFFLHYTSDVLDTIRYALEVFYVANGARINREKFYGILAGSDDIPTWGPRDFTWLRPGETDIWGFRADFHDYHHRLLYTKSGNYASTFTYMDRIFGTDKGYRKLKSLKQGTEVSDEFLVKNLLERMDENDADKTL
ncbi:hypothetical protein L7F22_012074 [Adiantum nelumboides]|nr:hypothetical protein [Adiantum nelumboides]